MCSRPILPIKGTVTTHKKFSLTVTVTVRATVTLCVKVKGKAIDFTSPRTSSGQASRPYEMVPIGTISSPSEGGRKPRGGNHQALAVKGERHPTCGLELNRALDTNKSYLAS